MKYIVSFKYNFRAYKTQTGLQYSVFQQELCCFRFCHITATHFWFSKLKQFLAVSTAGMILTADNLFEPHFKKV